MAQVYAYAPRALGALLSGSRAEIDPASIPQLRDLRVAAGLPPVPLRGPRPRGLSQRDMEVLLGGGLPSDWYSRLERGMIRNPPVELLRRVAGILGFGARQWEALWACLYGRPPTVVETLEGEGVAEVPPLWRTAVLASGVPAYVACVWDVLWFSPPAVELWGTAPDNILLWVLLDVEARERVMVDWRSCWGPAAVSQLASALRVRPTHPRLVEIRDAALRDPEVLTMWRQDPVVVPEGDRRLMRHAGTGRLGVVHVGVADLRSVPGCSLVVIDWSPA